MIEYPDGVKIWFLKNGFHRTNGPAIESLNGFKAWYLNGIYYLEEKHWQEEVTKYKSTF